jgi:RNA polymerase sigma-70 factor (ECF subfamily)
VSEEQLLAEARRGDEAAFERLVERHRGELHAHCYRMLGSVQDAEDAVQESLLAAWRGLPGFEARSSLRTWLYRVATHCCLRLAARRPPRMLSPDRGPACSDPGDLGEPVPGPVWLEPWADDLPAGDELDPAAAYLRRETVELAFSRHCSTCLAPSVRCCSSGTCWDFGRQRSPTSSTPPPRR